MPTYDYRCAKCGDELEVFQTFAEKPLTKHAGCGGKLAKYPATFIKPHERALLFNKS